MKALAVVLLAIAAIFAGLWLANLNQESIHEERFKTGYEHSSDDLKHKYQEALKNK